jgi:prepilin-type N-terminal cleavage/methylation domain-containing protein
MSSPRGFTLIELLIVITIIGILASTVYIQFQGMRAKARDAIRTQDIFVLGSATNMYYYDNITVPQDGTNTLTVNFLESELSEGKYISKIPLDPLPIADAYQYTYVKGANLDGSPNKGFEYNAQLEASVNDAKESDDGGNAGGLYETGTNLALGLTAPGAVTASADTVAW